MNLLLLSPDDFLSADRARLTGRRFRHLCDILRAEPGRPLRVGVINGLTGVAVVAMRSAEHVDLDVQLTSPPPPPVPITLLLALPRPKALRRTLQAVTAFGVKRIVLLNTARVDKSYWQSPLLAPAVVHEQLLLGLEQARDTRLPEVLLRPRFRPFVEDELPAMAAETLCLAAHPDGAVPCPCAPATPVTLAIGPEGGFVPFEITQLTALGFTTVHLGSRPLRVETVVPALFGRLLNL